MPVIAHNKWVIVKAIMKLKKTHLESKNIYTYLFQFDKIKPWQDYCDLTSRRRLINRGSNADFYNFRATMIYPVLDEWL